MIELSTLCVRFTTALALLSSVTYPLVAQHQLTQEEALELAFGSTATIERRTAYLADAQLDSAKTLAGTGVDVRQSVVTFYVGSEGGTPVGVAYFDVHRVRTQPEVLMVVVSPQNKISRIEVLKFMEPPDYRAPAGWLDRFAGTVLSNRLSLKGDVVAITGATLTSRAVTNATRRILALHRVIRPFAGEGN
ncbi:MAG: FMN-binding protein [Gemmatimonadales bacterium]